MFELKTNKSLSRLKVMLTQFHTLIQNFGVTKETADEVFRQGLSSIDTLKHVLKGPREITARGLLSSLT